MNATVMPFPYFIILGCSCCPRPDTLLSQVTGIYDRPRNSRTVSESFPVTTTHSSLFHKTEAHAVLAITCLCRLIEYKAHGSTNLFFIVAFVIDTERSFRQSMLYCKHPTTWVLALISSGRLLLLLALGSCPWS